MPTSSARDNVKNNRWKKGKKRTEMKLRVAQAVVKVWELYDFDVCVSSLIFKSNLELALSIILKDKEL